MLKKNTFRQFITQIYHTYTVHGYNLSFHQNVFCHSLSTMNREYACLDIVDCWIFNIAFCQRNLNQCHPDNAMVERKYYKYIFIFYKSQIKFTNLVCYKFRFCLFYIVKFNWTEKGRNNLVFCLIYFVSRFSVHCRRLLVKGQPTTNGLQLCRGCTSNGNRIEASAQIIKQQGN